jgi:hypothetical protein
MQQSDCYIGLILWVNNPRLQTFSKTSIGRKKTKNTEADAKASDHGHEIVYHEPGKMPVIKIIMLVMMYHYLLMR